MDDAESDLRNIGVRRWKIRGLDMKEWESVEEEAKAKRKGP
jgi:hypothetical protein